MIQELETLKAENQKLKDGKEEMEKLIKKAQDYISGVISADYSQRSGGNISRGEWAYSKGQAETASEIGNLFEIQA